MGGTQNNKQNTGIEERKGRYKRKRKKRERFTSFANPKATKRPKIPPKRPTETWLNGSLKSIA